MPSIYLPKEVYDFEPLTIKTEQKSSLNLDFSKQVNRQGRKFSVNDKFMTELDRLSGAVANQERIRRSNLEKKSDEQIRFELELKKLNNVNTMNPFKAFPR